MLTELLILLVIRTQRPWLKSKPGKYLLISALIVGGGTLILPYTPLSGLLGFTALPLSTLLVLGSIAMLYVATSEMAKKFFYARTRF